jgi:large conductance mechanosensitive channel
MFKEFRKFILRGNVVDLAVAVVIGAAFNGVVQSIVKDFITPLVTGFSSGGKKLEGVYTMHLRSHTFSFAWGDFLNTLISFILIAAVVFFLVVQPINKLQSLSNKRKTPEEPTDRKCPECLSNIPKAAKRCAFCTAKVTPETK